MKKQLTTAMATALLATGVSMSAQADTGISANVGFVSDYYFRGANLGDAGAYAGLDYGIAGFYVGTWIIDDGAGGNDGLETDFYLGYGMEHGIFSWDINYTRYEYTYTGDFEHEVGINLGLAGVSLGLVAGEDDDVGAKDPVDYNVFTLGYSYDAYGITLGHYVSDDGNGDGKDDSSYNWIEFSASGEVAGLDMGVTIGKQFGQETDESDSSNAGNTSYGKEYIVLDISKSFSF